MSSLGIPLLNRSLSSTEKFGRHSIGMMLNALYVSNVLLSAALNFVSAPRLLKSPASS